MLTQIKSGLRYNPPDYIDYVMEAKNSGVIRHIGMSSHNSRLL